MSLTIENVTKIAKLSRIYLSDDEKEHYRQELSQIFDWIEQLQEVNTDDEKDMISVTNLPLPMREDVVTDGGKQADVLANAPASKYGCYVVPKVIE